MEALTETINDPTPSQRKVTLIGSEPKDYRSFHFRKVHADEEIKKLWIGLEDEQPVLEFTDQAIAEVRKDFELWIEGTEDFQMYPDGKAKDQGTKEKNSGELWFWITMLP